MNSLIGVCGVVLGLAAVNTARRCEHRNARFYNLLTVLNDAR